MHDSMIEMQLLLKEVVDPEPILVGALWHAPSWECGCSRKEW
jgi:hypothetical protein